MRIHDTTTQILKFCWRLYPGDSISIAFESDYLDMKYGLKGDELDMADTPCETWWWSMVPWARHGIESMDDMIIRLDPFQMTGDW